MRNVKTGVYFRLELVADSLRKRKYEIKIVVYILLIIFVDCLMERKCMRNVTTGVHILMNYLLMV